MASRIISSKENKFYKYIKKLKDKKYRIKEKIFLAEGFKIFELNKNPKYIIIKMTISLKIFFLMKLHHKKIHKEFF